MLPGSDASRVPAHVLFPEAYEESKRMIVRDFAFFGFVLAGSVIVAALVAATYG